jgi:O-acetyl-ADP-ribose deacetylase (regulator of RNase III)
MTNDMGKIIYMQGDLFSSTTPAIGHGVNTTGVMGAGIAVAFKKEFPEMYEEYRQHCLDGSLEPGGLFEYAVEEENLYVYNLATQDKPGAHAHLDWLRSSLNTALWRVDGYGMDRIALPRIGAGLGGLAWEDVERVMLEVVANYKCDIELWTL